MEKLDESFELTQKALTYKNAKKRIETLKKAIELNPNNFAAKHVLLEENVNRTNNDYINLLDEFYNYLLQTKEIDENSIGNFYSIYSAREYMFTLQTYIYFLEYDDQYELALANCVNAIRLDDGDHLGLRYHLYFLAIRLNDFKLFDTYMNKYDAPYATENIVKVFAELAKDGNADALYETMHDQNKYLHYLFTNELESYDFDYYSPGSFQEACNSYNLCYLVNEELMEKMHKLALKFSNKYAMFLELTSDEKEFLNLYHSTFLDDFSTEAVRVEFLKHFAGVKKFKKYPNFGSLKNAEAIFRSLQKKDYFNTAGYINILAAEYFLGYDNEVELAKREDLGSVFFNTAGLNQEDLKDLAKKYPTDFDIQYTYLKFSMCTDLNTYLDLLKKVNIRDFEDHGLLIDAIYFITSLFLNENKYTEAKKFARDMQKKIYDDYQFFISQAIYDVLAIIQYKKTGQIKDVKSFDLFNVLSLLQAIKCGHTKEILKTVSTTSMVFVISHIDYFRSMDFEELENSIYLNDIITFNNYSMLMPAEMDEITAYFEKNPYVNYLNELVKYLVLGLNDIQTFYGDTTAINLVNYLTGDSKAKKELQLGDYFGALKAYSRKELFDKIKDLEFERILMRDKFLTFDIFGECLLKEILDNLD